MRRVALAVLVLALLLTAGWWTLSRHDGQDAARQRIVTDTQAALDPDSAAQPASPNSGREAALPTDAAPRSSEHAKLAGPVPEILRGLEPALIVLLADGRPARDAVLSWSPRDMAWEDSGDPRSDTAWRELAERTFFARAEPGGGFELPAEPPDHGQGSVLWITHPDAAAWSRRLPHGAGREALESPLLLAAGTSVGVHVVGALGHDVAAARVLAVRAPPRRDASAEVDLDWATATYFVREARTDEAGRVRIPDAGGMLRLVAGDGERASAPWHGLPPDEARLVLRPTFRVVGAVVPRDGSANVSDLVVTVRAHVERRQAVLARVPVTAQGEYGALDLPTLEPFAGELELSGGDWVAEFAPLDSPTAGETRRIDFHPVRGVALPVLVTDVEGAPIAGAAVEFVWQSHGQWRRALVRTEADGIAPMRAAPTGSVWIEVEARGFEPLRESHVIEASWSEPHRVRLRPAGTLRGRVLHAGQPVEGFGITYWRDQVTSRSWREFVGRRDGSFELESAPLGAVSLFAVSPEWGRSQVLLVEVGAEDSAAVELELDGCARARGVVIAGDTGEPIAGALVQPWITHENHRLDAWGPAVASDALGRFEIDCLFLGRGSLEVRAEGFALRRVETRAEPGRALDLQAIRLERGASLELVLALPDGASRSTYLGGLTGVDHHEPTPFPADGVLRFENLRPGLWTHSVLDDRGGARYGTVRVEPHARTRVVVHAAAATNCEVEIVEDSGHALVDHAYLYVTALAQVEAPEVPIQARWVPPERRVACRLAPGVEHDLLLVDGHGRRVGARRVPASADPPPRLRLEAGGPSARILVVGRDGDPLAGVEVHLDPGTGLGARRAETGADGSADFGPWPHPSANLRLERTDLGLGYVRGLALRVGREERITFDPSSLLRLRVSDAGTAIPMAEVRLFAPVPADSFLATRTADATGEARFDALLAGTYRLRVDDPATWPAVREIEVGPGATEAVVEVRRRGSLAFELARNGTPSAGARVELRSLEFGVDGARWVAEGRVLARPADTVTGSDGRVRFDGLPRGAYAWTARDPSGARAEGVAIVEAATCARVFALLDGE